MFKTRLKHGCFKHANPATDCMSPNYHFAVFFIQLKEFEL